MMVRSFSQSADDERPPRKDATLELQSTSLEQ